MHLIYKEAFCCCCLIILVAIIIINYLNRSKQFKSLRILIQRERILFPRFYHLFKFFIFFLYVYVIAICKLFFIIYLLQSLITNHFKRERDNYKILILKLNFHHHQNFVGLLLFCFSIFFSSSSFLSIFHSFIQIIIFI